MRQIRPEDHIGLACMIAAKFTTLHPIEDSEQFGDAMVGLMKAVEKFRPELGFQFSTFAYHVIKRQVIAGWKRRRKDATRISSTFLEDIPASRESFDVSEGVDTQDLLATMLENVSILPEQQRAVIEARLQGKKLREISEAMGLTKQRIQQIEERATRMLRCMMAQAGAIG
jgi:RNA polymerase sigma factor (sigma-70 family)